MSSNPAPGAGAGLGEASHRVLVVDDDLVFARSVADALEDRDIEVVVVDGPAGALDLARSSSFAAAVVDLIMPEMDGLELARALRRTSPAIEVILLTGHADMHSAIEAVRNEVFDYLQKDSLQTARLRRAVRAAIVRSQLRAENARLVVGLTESTRRLTVLNDLSARLAAEHHLDRLNDTILMAARDLLGAEAVRVVITERNDLGDVQIRSACGDGDVAVGAQFGPGDGIVAEVARNGVSVSTGYAADHPAYSPRCDDMGTPLPGFVCVPFAASQLTGALAVAGRSGPFTDEDVRLLASLARQGAIAVENAMAHEVNANFFTHTSQMLISLLDSHDIHYRGHARAVAALADMVSRRAGLSDGERRIIHFAALLHDVGKLRLPPGVLASEGPLNAEGQSLVRQHPALGVELLRSIDRWSDLAPVILSHHERWDGRGYPRELAGEEIPFGGRIVAIAEAFEAMVRPTPYRKGRSVPGALAEVRACAGTQFDPTLALLFVEEYEANRERLEESAE